MLVILLAFSGVACASEQSAGGAAAVRAEFSKLPLSFIPNQGQADPAVLFQAKAEGDTIFFTKDNVVLVADKDGTPAVFSTTVAGVNPDVTVVGVDPLPGKASFFVGNDPENWQSGLSTYGGVEYQNVLPGVDLTYRGTNGVLKREFVVAPGADASGIVIVYKNIDGITYGPDGTLQVQTPIGVLTETAPVCYQVINGNKVDVAAQYTILGDGRVGFTIGSYDKVYPLVIDPALLYSSYLGGAVNDAAMGITVDLLGQAYVTGYTDSTDFPVNYSFNMTPNGCSDVFVTKVSADGKDLLYSTYLGGNNTDIGNGIAVNDSGYAFITGSTSSPNFPTDPTGTMKNTNTTSPSPCPFPGCLGQDAFISVIAPDGLSLPYSTCIGGNSTDIGTSIAVSPDGTRVFTTGFTNSDNFPVTTDAYQHTLQGGSDAFIVVYTPGGQTNPPTYATYFGGTGSDEGLGIAVNWSSVNPTYYVTGWTQSTNFPHTTGLSTYSVSKDGFVSKFTNGTAAFTYSRYLGGNGNDEGRGIVVRNIAGTEYAYVTGVTYSTNFPVKPTSPPRFGGASYAYPNFGTSSNGDAFITQLEPTGLLNWSTYLGGIDSDGGDGIAVDANNNIYITGYTLSGDFPSINPIPGFGTKHAFQDAFITMVNSNRSSINFSTYLGGNLDDTGTGIAVSDPQNIIISGYTTSYDFPVHSLLYPNVNSFTANDGQYDGSQYPGWVNGFVAKINNLPTPAKPVARFTYTKLPYTCGQGQGVNFVDNSTGAPDTYSWDFGNGQTSNSPTPPTIYYTGGSFNVTLTVSNGFGTNLTYQWVNVSMTAGPKFTYANSTSAISEIHVAQNGTRKISLYLNATPQGLAGYNLTVSFRNSSSTIPPYVPDTVVANITNVSRPEWIQQNVDIWVPSDISVDSHNVTFLGINLSGPQPHGAQNVRLANITVMGNQIGNSTLHINSTNMMTNGDAQNMSLCPPDYNLTVYVERLQPLPGISSEPPHNMMQTPIDPNGDGLYEDVNGDGVVNVYDVIDFATKLYWITDGGLNDNVNEYQPFFDFDGNGVVNFYDVFILYNNIPHVI